MMLYDENQHGHVQVIAMFRITYPAAVHANPTLSIAKPLNVDPMKFPRYKVEDQMPDGDSCSLI